MCPCRHSSLLEAGAGRQQLELLVMLLGLAGAAAGGWRCSAASGQRCVGCCQDLSATLTRAAAGDRRGSWRAGCAAPCAGGGEPLVGGWVRAGDTLLSTASTIVFPVKRIHSICCCSQLDAEPDPMGRVGRRMSSSRVGCNCIWTQGPHLPLPPASPLQLPPSAALTACPQPLKLCRSDPESPSLVAHRSQLRRLALYLQGCLATHTSQAIRCSGCGSYARVCRVLVQRQWLHLTVAGAFAAPAAATAATLALAAAPAAPAALLAAALAVAGALAAPPSAA